MSVDERLPTKALVRDGRDRPKPVRDGPGRAAIVVLIAVQLAWVAGLVYGVHRAIEFVGGIA